MSLTAKQEKFIAEYVKCGNQSEAYRRAYNAQNMKPEVIHVKASELMAHGSVAVRVAAIRERLAAKTEYTLADHMKRLSELSDAAEKVEQFGVSVKAEELRGKVSGFYVERVEHSGGEVPVKVSFALDKPNGAGAEEL